MGEIYLILAVIPEPQSVDRNRLRFFLHMECAENPKKSRQKYYNFMRKQISLFSFCTCMFFGLVSCTPKNEPNNPHFEGTSTTTTNTLSVSPSELIWVGPNGGTKTVTVKCTTQWWCSIDNGNVTGMSVSPNSGNKNGRINISVGSIDMHNKGTFTAQHGLVVVYCDDGKGGTISKRIDITHRDYPSWP